jgi:hypothetical protein
VREEKIILQNWGGGRREVGKEGAHFLLCAIITTGKRRIPNQIYICRLYVCVRMFFVRLLSPKKRRRGEKKTIDTSGEEAWRKKT